MGGLQGAVRVVVIYGFFCCYALLCPTQNRNCFFKDDKETRPAAHPYLLGPTEQQQQQQFNLL